MVMVIGIGLILVIVFGFKPKKKINMSPVDAELIAKQKQLSQIESQIENKTIDRSVGLRKIEVKVLDMYDRSGIRIPSDIIEDLNHMNLDSEEEILKYIENQRYYWKLENTKKPYKGV